MFHLLSCFLIILGLHRRQPSNLPSTGIQFGRVKLLTCFFSSEAGGVCLNFAVCSNWFRKVLDRIRFAFFVEIYPSEGTSEKYSGSVSAPPAEPLLFSCHPLPRGGRRPVLARPGCSEVLHSHEWLSGLPPWHKQIKPYTSSTEKKPWATPALGCCQGKKYSSLLGPFWKGRVSDSSDDHMPTESLPKVTATNYY